MSQISLTSTFLNMATGSSQSVGSSNNTSSQSVDTFSKELSKAKDTTKANQASKKENDSTSRSQDKKDYQAKNENVKKDDVISDKPEDELEKTDEKVTVDDQILAMVSQALQMPIEEIEAQLSSMGLSVQDLLTTEGFGKFINQVMAEGDINALLSGDLDIKQISNLFNELTNLNEEINIDAHLAPDSQEHLETNIEMSASLGEEQAAIYEEIMMQNTAEEAITNQSSENRYKMVDEETHLSFMPEEGTVDSGLGITVPIHNFTTSSFTQTFQNDAGQVTQMVTTKQMVNGKAFIEQIDFKVLAQSKEINVSLSPKELGQMNIKVMEQNGVMVAEIKVENEKAKEFILNEIEQLKENLEEQGLNVADVKVDIRQENHQTQQMEQERQKSSKRIQEIISQHLEEQSEEDMVERPILSNSEVDYMV